MNLNFSVLWFDDNEDYFDSLDIDPLKEEIASWGFNPQIKKVTTPEEFNNCSPFKKYDLIVVDRNLEGYENGQNFIANIRSNAIYTEVIFYTAGKASDLWEAIQEKQLEGVFVSDRENIIAKILKVGHQSIRKILDLENMRGIVMAEVSELDLLLDDIITLGIESLDENQQQSIFKRFYENAKQQNKDTIETLDEFIKNPDNDSMIKLCDSDKRWRNFNRLWKKHKKLKAKERIGDYVKDVLSPRNILAHGKPEPLKDGGYRFSYSGKEYIFNDEKSLELRQKILKYKHEFSAIIDLIRM